MTKLLWPSDKKGGAAGVLASLATLTVLTLCVGLTGIGGSAVIAQDGTYNPSHPCTPWPQCAAQPQGQGGGNVGAPPATPPPPTHRWVNVAIAAATHPEANDVWVIWDTESNVKRVEADVVAACTRSMGNGCKVEMSGTNGAIAVSRNANGWLNLGWGTNARTAGKAALKYCRDSNMQCTLQKSYTAEAWQKRIGGNEPDRVKTYFPDANSAIPRVAVIAWPGSKPQDPRWYGKTWVSTGTRGRSNAERALIEKCSTDTGTQCVIGQGSFDGALLRYTTNRDGGVYWIAVSSGRDAAKSLKEYCKIKVKGAQCKLVNIFDSQTEAMIVIDDSLGTN